MILRDFLLFVIICAVSILSIPHVHAQPKSTVQATRVIAGPMLGAVELRTARIWYEVPVGSNPALRVWRSGRPDSTFFVLPSAKPNDWYLPVVFDVVNLQPETRYEFALVWNRSSAAKPLRADGSFQTQPLWQWRKPAPELTFLAGSCAYTNEPVYDRPGKPYGGDSSIYETMAREPASFMLWLGDNWYTREADYFSRWGLWYRAHHDRRQPVLQPLLKAMSHYATWDDHDYGPNDMGAGYVFKDESREVFRHYWANPSYGLSNRGVYTKFTASDVDFFLLDDRTFRDSDFRKDTVNGGPNPGKRMWGEEQLNWLMNALKESTATFKVVVNGSQVLNRVSGADALYHFPLEFTTLMDFLQREQVRGVVFMSGDRHHSEVIRYPMPGYYTLYDITASSLTAGVYVPRGAEENMEDRVPGTLVTVNNYAKIRVTGPARDRVLSVEFLDRQGVKLASWQVSQKELGYSR